MAWPTFSTATFGSSTTRYGRTVFLANETLAGATGKLIELEAQVYGTDTSDSTLGIGTSTDGIYFTLEGAVPNNRRHFRYNSGAETTISTLASEGQSHDATGIKTMRMILWIHSTGQAYFRFGQGHNWNPTASGQSYTSSNLATTLTPFLQTSDISRCSLTMRIVG